MTRFFGVGLLVATTLLSGAAHAGTVFLPGNLVVSVEGNGVEGASSGPFTDNQAAPLSLFDYSVSGSSSATYVDADVLPQTAHGANHAISGEYGSSSEGILQLTANGKYLTILGYGVNAAAFNADPTSYGTLTTDPTKPTALGQSGSLVGQGYTPVPRVVALIGSNGGVNTTTALTGVFNGNNPRSVVSADGSSFYVSGQGNSPDATGGVFYAQLGASTATPITGLDTNSGGSAQDTRVVEIVGGQLYVSVDSKEGSGSNRDFIGTLGSGGALPTSLANGGAGPAQLAGFGGSNAGKTSISAATGNGVNTGAKSINLSPEQYFFANADTLYVADSGNPKNNSASSPLGDGGLQKWVNQGGVWTLEYTLASGLNLVPNSAASGSTGLFALTGKVEGGEVLLYVTNATVGDTDPTFLFGITDQLAAKTPGAGEGFTELAAAPADSNFKGLAFAPSATLPVPEPDDWVLMALGVGLIGGALRAARARRGMAITTT